MYETIKFVFLCVQQKGEELKRNENLGDNKQ